MQQYISAQNLSQTLQFFFLFDYPIIVALSAVWNQVLPREPFTY